MSMPISFQLKVCSHIQTKSTESPGKKARKRPLGLQAAQDRELFVSERPTDLDYNHFVNNDEAVSRWKLELQVTSSPDIEPSIVIVFAVTPTSLVVGLWNQGVCDIKLTVIWSTPRASDSSCDLLRVFRTLILVRMYYSKSAATWYRRLTTYWISLIRYIDICRAIK